MTDTIRQHQMPQTLNGFPVKAFSISARADRVLVLVHRPGSFQPWVAATWWPELGDTWMWGNYFASYEEADAYRANWIRTYAVTRAPEAEEVCPDCGTPEHIVDTMNASMLKREGF